MGDIFPYARKCNNCGKEIFPNPSWVYKKGATYYCSWKCFRHHDITESKQKVVLPKIGDTIRIIRVPNLPQCSGKVGVVEFYDAMGQLHGTWGWWVIVPGIDSYEIIDEKTDEE